MIVQVHMVGKVLRRMERSNGKVYLKYLVKVNLHICRRKE
nr:MAG TPA: hypothetical protein [Caudoviricetes sp.]